MFIRDFKKLRLVLTSVISVALVYVGLNAGLLLLARWAETNADTYPYRDQDWLRYLLPTFFEDRSHARIFLTGESAVREGLIYERFDHKFGNMRTFQGALSLGTLDDVLLSLDYIEKIYGLEALPEMLIVGISPRFVANIPDERPLTMAINGYSPFYRVEQTQNGPRLVPKTRWEGELSRARFFLKQQTRYRAALFGLIRKFLEEDVPYDQFHRDFGKMRSLMCALRSVGCDFSVAIAFVDEVGVKAALGRWLRVFTSPYKYHYLPPMPRDGIQRWLQNPQSWWIKVHNWDPRRDARAVRIRFARLLGFVKRHRIQLYVVNVPENELSRSLYRPENYERYYNLVLELLDNTPFLDLREMLKAEDFYDVVHPSLPSALRVTDRVVEFITNHRNGVEQAAHVVSVGRPLANGRRAKRTGE